MTAPRRTTLLTTIIAISVAAATAAAAAVERYGEGLAASAARITAGEGS